MKILEIVNTEYTNKDAADRLTFPSAKRMGKKKIGGGSYATVYKGDDDIEVTKVEHQGEERSSYDVFVRAIVEGDLSSENPYFPRIYKRTTVSKTQQIEYEMEELLPLIKFLSHHPEHIQPLAEKIFNEKDVASIGNRPIVFEQFLDDMSDHPRSEGNDPLFDEAIDILFEIQANAGTDALIFDLHSENYMIRLTSKGPQIVITDPFA